ncbi:PoNe immunity protein domain-containing protein [Variovorax sp. W2I14]|uniref:PoNe immunity protein domain-containing protein n=1 Tax=Variovorax sp. W2I14 TaxID=3042290 RepID=UPI003D2086F6
MINSPHLPFHLCRRQQFLDESYYLFLKEFDVTHTMKDIEHALLHGNLSDEMRWLEHLRKADELYEMMSRDYTAGQPIGELREQFGAIVQAYKEAAYFNRVYEKEPAMPLFDFKHKDDYVRVVALLSLAILLHREDLIPSVHSLFKGGAPDENDALIEDFLGKYLPDRPYLETGYHEIPYGILLDATAETPMEEKQEDIGLFLKAWYLGMKGTGWYNSHKKQSPDGAGGYFGYWAFEAATVAYLYDVDDAPFREHLVYPKDLADFARSMPRLTVEIASKQERVHLRGIGGEPCPQAGWWFTPALTGSRRYFKQDEVMPVIEGSDYGSTFWQWDVDQSAPKL